jgi:hypothetical protein
MPLQILDAVHFSPAAGHHGHPVSRRLRLQVRLADVLQGSCDCCPTCGGPLGQPETFLTTIYPAFGALVSPPGSNVAQGQAR